MIKKHLKTYWVFRGVWVVLVLFFNCCFSLFAFEISYHETETRNAVNIVRIKERQSLLQNGLKSPVNLLASYSKQQIMFCFSLHPVFWHLFRPSEWLSNPPEQSIWRCWSYGGKVIQQDDWKRPFKEVRNKLLYRF